MSDLISREAVYMANEHLKPCSPKDVEDMISCIPSAQQWIPCSTALPKDEEEVIVSIHDDSGDYVYDYTSFGWYVAAGKFWVVDNEINRRVVAWMPLPEPYREGEKP